MDGFGLLGKALGGDSEQAYQEGRALGAKTEDALAAARERVEKNAAKQRISQTAKAAGIPQADADLYADVLTAGGNLGDLFGGLKNKQEIGLRDRASNPDLPFDQRNIALQGVASGPVSRFDTVGKGHYQDKFSNDAPIDLGGAFGADGGGEAGEIQLLKAFGYIDPTTGMVPEAQRADAFDFRRDTTRNVDAGGIPLQTTNNPFRRGAPQPIAAPGMPPAAAPPSVQRATVAPASEVAANTAAVAAGKERGSAAGRAAAGLPTTISTIDKFDADIDKFLLMPGFDSAYGNLQGTTPGSIITGLASQDASNAQAQLESLGGEAFLASNQKMRGFGQLSNQEGGKVQTALTRAVNTKIGSDDARTAWAEVKQHLTELKRVAQIEANMGAAPDDAVLSIDDYLKSKGH